jgi:L-alanine-DL-glutamate epimerase-like enolase superfamily enzyme
MSSDPRIRKADFTVCTVPTDAPEADGTFEWKSTTLVLAELSSGDATGIGYTYGSEAIGALARHLAATCLIGHSPFDIPGLNIRMARAVRNDGNRGVGAMAISMLDIALWDLKARLLGCSMSRLLGRARDQVPVYGSGGFTSYSNEQLQQQLSSWAASGIRMMKIKVGTNPGADPARVKTARAAIGKDSGLFVDANGAYAVKQALALAEAFHEQQVEWFEEPVSSDHVDSLRLIRERAPAGMEIAAGEYAYNAFDFLHLLKPGAVDVLQADATRCGGFSGFLAASRIAASFGCPLSAHCAPSLHMHVCCAPANVRHLEYFHDHVRIERMLFDGHIEQRNGFMRPDDSRPGLGFTLKRKDALRYAA